MKNDNFGLLGGLFANPVATSKAVNTPIEKNTKEAETKRTWKIKDAFWSDFVVLVNLSGLTQAEYINLIIGDAIDKNREKIDRYREITVK